MLTDGGRAVEISSSSGRSAGDAEGDDVTVGFRGFVLQGRDETGVAVGGSFDVESSSAGLVRPLSCVTGNDTVTHSSARVKHVVILVWNSPQPCSSNDVYFR